MMDLKMVAKAFGSAINLGILREVLSLIDLKPGVERAREFCQEKK